MREYLFLCGTPRSGTTFLANLINYHPRILIGVERFKFHYSRKSITPDLFVKERFFDLRKEDTSHRLANALPNAAAMMEKYDSCELLGDKYPNIIDYLDVVDSKFPGATYLVALRNPIHVARSWEVRAMDDQDHWPRRNGYKAALEFWKKAIAHTVSAHAKGVNVVLADYDTLVSAPEEEARSCMERLQLGLGVTPSDTLVQRLLSIRLPSPIRAPKDILKALTPEEQRDLNEVIGSPEWRAFQDSSLAAAANPVWSRKYYS